MEAEVRKLEELLRGGFIVKEELDQRKQDLLLASAGSVAFSPYDFPLDVGRYFFDYATNPNEPITTGLKLLLVCRTWSKIGSRHPGWMYRVCSQIRQAKIADSKFKNDPDSTYMMEVLKARIPAKALSTIQLIEGACPDLTDYNLERLFEIVGVLCLHGDKSDPSIIHELITQGTARVCNQFAASSNDNARRGAVWCLSNFVIFSEGMAEYLGQPDALPRLLSILNRRPFVDQGTLRVTIWTIANLVGKSASNREKFFKDPSVIQSYTNFTRDAVARYSAVTNGKPSEEGDKGIYLDFDVVEHSLRGLYSLAGRATSELCRDASHAQQLIDLEVAKSTCVPVVLLASITSQNRLLAASYALGVAYEISKSVDEAIVPLIESSPLLDVMDVISRAAFPLLDPKISYLSTSTINQLTNARYCATTLWQFICLLERLPSLDPMSFSQATLTRLFRSIANLLTPLLAPWDDDESTPTDNGNCVPSRVIEILGVLSSEWKDHPIWTLELGVISDLPNEDNLLYPLSKCIGFKRYPSLVPFFFQLQKSAIPSTQETATLILEQAVAAGTVDPLYEMTTPRPILEEAHVEPYYFINKKQFRFKV